MKSVNKLQKFHVLPASELKNQTGWNLELTRSASPPSGHAAESYAGAFASPPLSSIAWPGWYSSPLIASSSPPRGAAAGEALDRHSSHHPSTPDPSSYPLAPWFPRNF